MCNNNNELLRNFIQEQMGNILKERLPPEEFKSVMTGILMVIEEVSTGRINNIYDVLELIQKPDLEIELLKKAINDKEKIISLQKEIMECNNFTQLRIVP